MVRQLFPTFYPTRHVHFLILGLETLGLFHPHWLSASSSSQARLISAFLSPASNTERFTADLESSGPHDVAAVFKWGLRHTSPAPDPSLAWYSAFATAERNASFPHNAFGSIALPNAPLIKALLDLCASVASHADGNGFFNTRLAKALAWWIVGQQAQVHGAAHESWDAFYGEWDKAARVLEHVFLAYLRFVGCVSLPL